MIRTANEHDLRHLTRLSEIYHKEHWFGEHTQFDYNYCFDQIKAGIISPFINVLVAECEDCCTNIVGYSGAFLCPLHYSPQVRCTVAYNYIDPAHRSNGMFNEMIQLQTDWALDNKSVDINIADGGQYKGKFGIALKGLGFDRTGTDSYKVLAQ